jgi:hypothetical protein
VLQVEDSKLRQRAQARLQAPPEIVDELSVVFENQGKVW